MRLFRLLLTFQLIALCSLVDAQTLSVESFRLLENDLAANTQGTMMRDQNGEVAALIRIVTTEKGFVFDGGMMGIVGTKQDVGEILLYVPYGIQKITIKHDQLGVIRDYYFPIPIEKARTYEMKLVSGRVKTIIEDEQTTQFLVFKVEPPTASVYLDGRIQSLRSDGSVSVLVEFGNHEYRVEAAGFITEAGVVQVGREKVTKEVSLKSAQGQLSLFVDNPDAGIWLNGELKGNGSWTGMVDPGKYVAEAKLEHYHSRSVTFDVNEQEEKNVTLTPPEPMYGFIQFDSDPVETTIFLDGHKVGVTPFILQNVLEGEHTVRYEKKGYHSYETTINVAEGKRAEVFGSLNDFFTASITSNPNGASVKIDGKSVGVTPYEKEMSSGDYHIVVHKSGFRTFDEKVRLDATDSTLFVRLPRQYFNSNGFYVSAMMDILIPPGINSSLGFTAGLYFKGFNLELGYHDKYEGKYSANVYYVSSNNDVTSQNVGYNVNRTLTAKTGYGFIPGHRFRITPQMGIGLLAVSGTDGSESFVVSGVVNVTVEMAIVNHISLFASPGYSFPFMRGQLMESVADVSENASNFGNGLGISAGLSIFF